MKTKIAAISLLTVAILVLSILILQTTVSNIKDEALILTTTSGDTRIAQDEITEGVLELPVYKKRSISATRHSQAYTGQNSSRSILPSKISEEGIASTNPHSYTGSATSVKGSQKSSDEGGSVNYRPLASLPSWRAKPSGAMSASPGAGTDAAQKVSNVSAPFSGGGLSGPMRMDGDDENPPPEGMPVGNGLWLMIAFAGIYILIKRIKENSHVIH